eukprot:TRINITY_DN937_c0_g2_i1.p1 TRINITY_DN937_c0_g2~~TRINITY_DN937_c0_g2_i1.p1  ORF type:complete len:780 (+),score=148.67 TRINITY_DN937_c0_g2_i1:69-2408(+)
MEESLPPEGSVAHDEFFDSFLFGIAEPLKASVKQNEVSATSTTVEAEECNQELSNQIHGSDGPAVDVPEVVVPQQNGAGSNEAESIAESVEESSCTAARPHSTPQTDVCNITTAVDVSSEQQPTASEQTEDAPPCPVSVYTVPTGGGTVLDDITAMEEETDTTPPEHSAPKEEGTADVVAILKETEKTQQAAAPIHPPPAPAPAPAGNDASTAMVRSGSFPEWLMDGVRSTERKRYSFASSSSGSTGEKFSALEKTKSIDMLEALLDQGIYTKPKETPEAQGASAARNAADEAAHHAECAVCFEPLCDGPSVVFVDADRYRVCRHYFHEVCVKDLRPDSEQIFRCPLCRTPFSIMTKMPDPRLEPKIWFQLACTSKTGQLTKMEVRDVLLATVNTDCDVLESVVEKRWKGWDKSQTGSITAEEADGLLEFVRMNVPGRRHKPPPSLITDPGSWFEFIDTSGKGLLTEGQISRGLIKSFKGGGAEISEIARMVGELFPLFATANPDPLSPLLRGEGFEPPQISKADFLMVDGLAHAIVAELRHENVKISTYQEQEDEEFAAQLQREIDEQDEPTDHPLDIINVVPWSCPVCTFHNVPSDDKCQMCEAPKPAPPPDARDRGTGCTAAPVPGSDDVGEETEVQPMPVFVPPPRQVTPPLPQQRLSTPPPPQPPVDDQPVSQTSPRRFSTPANETPIPQFPPESSWEADANSDACHGCQSKFTFFLRRHHCRGCGRLHCSDCTPIKMIPGKGHIRICNPCYQHPSVRWIRQLNRRNRAQSSMR